MKRLRECHKQFLKVSNGNLRNLLRSLRHTLELNQAHRVLAHLWNKLVESCKVETGRHDPPDIRLRRGRELEPLEPFTDDSSLHLPNRCLAEFRFISGINSLRAARSKQVDMIHLIFDFVVAESLSLWSHSPMIRISGGS